MLLLILLLHDSLRNRLMDAILFATSTKCPNKGVSLFMNMRDIDILTFMSVREFIFFQLPSVQSGAQCKANVIDKLQQQREV